MLKQLRNNSQQIWCWKSAWRSVWSHHFARSPSRMLSAQVTSFHAQHGRVILNTSNTLTKLQYPAPDSPQDFPCRRYTCAGNTWVQVLGTVECLLHFLWLILAIRGDTNAYKYILHAVSTQKLPVHPIHFEQNLLWSQIAVCRKIWALSYQATDGEADRTCWKLAWPKWTHSSNTVSKTSMTICCFQTNWADFEESVDSGPSKNIPVSINHHINHPKFY